MRVPDCNRTARRSAENAGLISTKDHCEIEDILGVGKYDKGSLSIGAT